MHETDLTVPISTRVQTAPRRPPRLRAGATPILARRRGGLRAVIVTMRPHQWIKNLLVIAAAGAAGALGHDDVPVRVGLAFVAFCLLASGIYAINDVRDADEDRLHPRKRHRPVAAGELAPEPAIALGASLMVGGLVLCVAIQPLLAVVGAGYLALTLSYTLVWRHLLLLDIIAIAGGFMLRAVAGGVAAPVELSRWFVLVVSAAAVFVAAGKRHAELRRTTLSPVAAGGRGGGPRGGAAPGGGPRGGAAPTRRRVLEGYTPARLRLILITSALVTLSAYAYWAFELPSVHGVPWRPLTLLPAIGALARYAVLLARGQGEAPEELLLHDRLLQLAGLLWLALFAL